MATHRVDGLNAIVVGLVGVEGALPVLLSLSADDAGRVVAPDVGHLVTHREFGCVEEVNCSHQSKIDEITINLLKLRR